MQSEEVIEYPDLTGRIFNIENRNYKIQNVPGDGSCFFYSLALFLLDESDSHDAENFVEIGTRMRKLIVEYAVKDNDEVKELIKMYRLAPEESPVDDLSTVDEYREEMLKVDTYVDGFIIQKAANFIGRKLFIHRFSENQTTKIVPDKPTEDPDPVVLVYHQDLHYYACVRVR